jgi:starch-binding outer membrane protein, SusD/RagB family
MFHFKSKQMENYSIKKILLGIFISLLLGSCRKFIQIEPSPNLTASATVFQDNATATAAVLGLYTDMRSSANSYCNAGASLFGALSSDEIYNTTTSTTYDPYYFNDLQASTASVSSNFYAIAYKNIYRINAVLEGLSVSSGITDSLKRQLQGEMLVCRAFNYFYLVNFFSDVPLVTVTDYRVSSAIARTPVSDVYRQIEEDLLTAQALLPAGYANANRSRPNKWTATALLARVYLYRGDWLKAENEAAQVINAGPYNLLSNLNNVFLIASTETIWQLPSGNDASNTAQGGVYVPSGTTVRPTFAMTSQLLNVFEVGDQRKGSWLKSNTVSSVQYFYPNKYKVRTTVPPVTEYNVMLRLAEIYLIRAEARAKQDKLTEAKADLNAIRTRAGLSGTPAVTKEEILAAIVKERRTELFTEWADRWLDLKRTGQINHVLSGVKGTNWQLTDQLYPIPEDELNYNPRLTQNPGY